MLSKISSCRIYPLGSPVDGMTEFCLASTYNKNIDAAGWYYSDKLDGIRCQWSGREMFTRRGTKLSPPDYFVSELPGSPLDGELYVPADVLSVLATGHSIDGLWFDTTREKIVNDKWTPESKNI
jgi:ATP-dependent DNA ligase